MWRLHRLRWWILDLLDLVPGYMYEGQRTRADSLERQIRDLQIIQRYTGRVIGRDK